MTNDIDFILFLIFHVLINELIKLGAMEYSGLLHDVWLWYLSMLTESCTIMTSKISDVFPYFCFTGCCFHGS